jgi:putative pyruvate formate lyase activating enzyme
LETTLTYSIAPQSAIGAQFKATLIAERLETVRDLARSCSLCPRECGVNRLLSEFGTCKIAYGPVYSSVSLHHGEEPPISGYRGSGTVFFTGCNLRCMFCQNYPISQLCHGVQSTITGLAEQMLWLQEKGAHNINLVTPTHQTAAIFEALGQAYQAGLSIPIVYNSGGYESLEMLRLWDGIIDVYMPDAKYSDDAAALEISNAPDYVRHNRAALKEMHRQVGVLQVDDDGSAVRGLLIRHLVLPEGKAGTEGVFRFISEELTPATYLSLMSQYFPAWEACDHPVFGRRLTRAEYQQAVDLLEKYGLEDGWTQPY